MLLIVVSSSSLDAHIIKILGLSTECVNLRSSEELERMKPWEVKGTCWRPLCTDQKPL